MKAYVISLAKHQDRWKSMETRLGLLGLYPELHPGVLIDEVRGRCKNPGEYGCMLAQYRVLKKIADYDQTAMVFEDDVRFRLDLTQETLMDTVDRLKKFKMILLGATQYNFDFSRRPLKDYYFANRRTCGMFAYVVKPEFAAKCCELVDSGHVDAMDRTLKDRVYPNIQVPVVYPNLAIADVSTSDIREARSRRIHAKRVGWNLKMYE